MSMYILAGGSSEEMANSLAKRIPGEIKFCDDLPNGLSNASLDTSVTSVVVFDQALVKGDRQYNLKEVFKIFENLATATLSVHLITKSVEAQDIFISMLYTNPYCRVSLTDKITLTRVVDLILDRPVDEPEPPTAMESEPDVTIESVATVEESNGVIENTTTPTTEVKTIEGVKEPLPEPTPEPKPKTEPKPKQPLFSGKLKKGKSSKNIKSMLAEQSAIVYVTGNHNSGVTGLACNIFNALKNGGMSTALIDLDLDMFDCNFYMDCWDKNSTGDMVKRGLSHTLLSLSQVEKAMYKVTGNSAVLGCETGHEVSSALMDFNLDTRISDTIESVASKYKLVIVHVPISLLKKYPKLSRTSDSIIYCSNSTINGVLRAAKNLEGVGSDRLDIESVCRKIRFVLTNVLDNVNTGVDESNFNLYISDELECLEKGYGVVGSIKSWDKYDCFDKVKLLESDRSPDNFLSILYKSLGN